MHLDDDIKETQVSILPNGRMTPKNAALYTGLAEKTLAMKRCDGTGPLFTKVGGRVFYTKEALDNWLDGQGEFTTTLQAQFHQQQGEGE